jgi:hypothetical protein
LETSLPTSLRNYVSNHVYNNNFGNIVWRQSYALEISCYKVFCHEEWQKGTETKAETAEIKILMNVV